MGRNIGRMRAGQVVATVFCLFVCMFPMQMAFVQAEQIAEQKVGTLFEQITGMDVGSVKLGAGDDFTVTQRDGSKYVFENVGRTYGSAIVRIYDSKGELVNTAVIQQVQVPDNNRIDFEVELLSSNYRDYVLSGSITGLRDKPATAVGSFNSSGESRAAMIDYGGIGEADAGAFVIVTSMDGANKVAIIDDAIIIFVVVLFVALTCLLLGWWGCG